MNKYINQLLQMHDLEIALRENKVIHKGKNLDEVCRELQQNINEVKNNLPLDILLVYERISVRYDLSICPMINNTCNGCFMLLPVGVANKVRSDSQIVNCPNCNRFLYFDDSQIERPSGELHYKGVARFSSPELMFPKIKAKSKEDAIKKIAMKSAEVGFVEDGREFANALIQRESLFSTAVESGIAFPHARGVKACGLTLSVGTLEKGIDIGEEKPLQLLFVSAVPRQTSIFYLELVSKLAQYFGKPENIEKTVSCSTADEIWKILVQVGK